MTRALYAIAERCLRFLPVDAAGRRCFDETLADWRREAAQASGPVAALVVPARAMSSVFRCVLMVSLRDIRTREGAVLLLRLAGVSILCMMVLIAIRWNDAIDVEGTRIPMGPVPGMLLSVQIVTALPVLAFLCAAIGRRSRTPVSRLGPVLVSFAVMFVAMGWVLPAANQAYREFMFLLQARGPLPQPGINERSIVELVGMLFTPDSVRATFGLSIRLVFLIAVPVMLVIGTTAKTLTGWRRVAGSVLPVLVFLTPAAIGLNRYGAVAWWPALLGAVVVTRALARQDDASLERA